MNRTTTAPSRKCASLLLIVGLVAALTPSVSLAWQEDREPQEHQRRYGDRVSILSGDIHVPAHVDRRGMIFSLGGDVTIEGSVREVVVVFGRIIVRGGTVRGQVVGVMSEIELSDARIGDQLVNVLGTLNHDHTMIDGQTVNISVASWFPGLSAMIFWCRMFLIFLAFIVLLLLAALVPERIRVIGEAAADKYVAAFFVGILGYLGLAIIFSLLVATVIGIPVALLGFYVFKWMGVAGIFYVVGRRIGRGFGREMSLLGAILVTFAIFTVLRLMPGVFGIAGIVLSLCLWTLFFLLIEIPAVGLVILTRLGTTRGEPAVVSGPAYPVPSAYPAPSVPSHGDAPPPPDPTPSSPPPPSSTPPPPPEEEPNRSD